MQRYQSIIACLLLLLLSNCAALLESDIAKIKKEKIYTPAQLRADLNFFNTILREVHPEPFSRLEQNKYEDSFDQLFIQTSWPQRRRDFFINFAPLVSSLSDIHTRALYPFEEQQDFLEQEGQFPLAVLYSTEGLIVVADQQKIPLIPIGAKLISINKIEIDTILDKFKNYIPAETVTGHRRMIQMEFANLLWSVYQIEGDYDVEFIWQNQQHSRKIKGIKSKAIEQVNSTASHYGLIPIDTNTSVLWLNDFNEEYDKFEEFLDYQFKELVEQNKSNLILDLRYNQGGITDNLALLLAYLTSKPINWATHATLKLSEPFREQHGLMLNNAKNQKYGNYLDWLPVEYLNFWQWEILFAADGELLETNIKSVVSEKQHYFTGNIIVLSNGYCFSACASLVATLEKNRLATVIGESPGSMTNVQYGYPIEITLPNTGLRVIIPAMKFILENTKDLSDNTLVPEYEVERLKLDVLLGRDPVLEFALGLLK
ncbi:MAG: hypothetical protein ACI9N9_001468 [Enterobacterales bacterium]|jgi:hypothetical protein